MNYKIITFGCQMNVHESEKIAGILMSKGYVETVDVELADVVVLNTCAIRDTAEQHAMGNIGALKPIKKRKKSMIIAVVGCMSEQDEVAEKLREKFPFVDIVLGTSNIDKIGDAIDSVIARHKRYCEIEHLNMPEIKEDVPVYRTSGTNAWVNIMYGCNNFCTYCIVPYVRGRERSREPQKIIDEVEALLKEGYKEITLLGQNVNSYMPYEDKSWDFKRLLAVLGDLPYKYRLRFMTSHPKDFDKDVIDIIKNSKNICHNIHIPVQSGSNNVLKAMNRKYTREQYLSTIATIKKALPDVGITSDIMVGFPGETEEDFLDTLELVKEVGYSSCFTFIYSVRKGTVAEKMEQIPYKIKKDRITRLIALQNSITKQESANYIGNVYEVLIEDVKGDGYVCGRTESGRLVTIPGSAELIGEFCMVKVTSAKSASLFGELYNG